MWLNILQCKVSFLWDYFGRFSKSHVYDRYYVRIDYISDLLFLYIISNYVLNFLEAFCSFLQGFYVCKSFGLCDQLILVVRDLEDSFQRWSMFCFSLLGLCPFAAVEAVVEAALICFLFLVF